MPTILESVNRVGNFLKYEAHREEALARTVGVVAYAKADGAEMEVGQVLEFDTDHFKEILDTEEEDPAAKNLAILLDDRIDELVAADKALAVPTGKVTVALLVGKLAPCIVRQGGLNYGAVGTTATIAQVNAALESLNKIRVE